MAPQMINSDVLEFVQSELSANADANVRELQEAAAEIDPDVGKINVRQFRARYVLTAQKNLEKAGDITGTSDDGTMIDDSDSEDEEDFEDEDEEIEAEIQEEEEEEDEEEEDQTEEIRSYIRSRLEEDPDVENSDLQEEIAERFDESVADMGPRSFNATYPLQVKRELLREAEAASPTTKKRKKSKSRTTSTKKSTKTASTPQTRTSTENDEFYRISGILLSFAREVGENSDDLNFVYNKVAEYAEMLG